MPNPVNEPEVHAYLTNFYVVPGMRSHGFGKRLLNKAVSWCRSQGVDSIILWASPGNRSLYRRCGLGNSADIFELRHAARFRARLARQNRSWPVFARSVATIETHYQ